MPNGDLTACHNTGNQCSRWQEHAASLSIIASFGHGIEQTDQLVSRCPCGGPGITNMFIQFCLLIPSPLPPLNQHNTKWTKVCHRIRFISLPLWKVEITQLIDPWGEASGGVTWQSLGCRKPHGLGCGGGVGCLSINKTAFQLTSAQHKNKSLSEKHTLHFPLTPVGHRKRMDASAPCSRQAL